MFKPIVNDDPESDNETDDFSLLGLDRQINGYIHVSHLKKWYEPNMFINWVGMTYNRIEKAKKKSSKEHYNHLLQCLRADYLRELQNGNITPKLTRYIKDYPNRVGAEVSEWYKEASVQSM